MQSCSRTPACSHTDESTTTATRSAVEWSTVTVGLKYRAREGGASHDTAVKATYPNLGPDSSGASHRGVGQPGRPSALGAGCRRFKSSRPDQSAPSGLDGKRTIHDDEVHHHRARTREPPSHPCHLLPVVRCDDLRACQRLCHARGRDLPAVLIGAMPARRNRPGKSGCPPLPEVLRQEEGDVMLAVRRHFDECDSVFWATLGQIAACLRLVEQGKLRRTDFNPNAFRLPT